MKKTVYWTGMKRSTQSILLAAAILVIGGAVIVWMVIRFRLIPSPAPAPAPAPAALTEEKYSAVDLYIAGPADGPASVDRVELTLLKATATRKDGKTFTVTEKPVRIELQRDVMQKAVNDLLPEGPYGTLTLTFAPTGQLVPKSGAPTLLYLPKPSFDIDLGAAIPRSRTLAALVHMKLEGFGVKENVATFTLPSPLTAETYVLGGIYVNARWLGNVLSASAPTIASAIKADLGIDIAPVSGQTGSPGYTPPTSNPTPQQ